MDALNNHPTQALINLDNLAHNMKILSELAGNRPLWPAVKANAYGHGADLVAGRLISLGYKTLCVAHVSEAIELLQKGHEAAYIILSPGLADNAELIARHGLQPFICTLPQAEALNRAARDAGKKVSLHLKVDTGMGRVGVRPEDAADFLDALNGLPGLEVRGVASHFPRADEADQAYSKEQLARFIEMQKALKGRRIPYFHFANSAALFSLPDAHFDALRPGIAIYGLKPSPDMNHHRLDDLKPVLSLVSRITYIKKVQKGTGISYGHNFVTDRDSVIASIPLGYGDGVSRLLSGRMQMLVRGVRCPQVGRICMDQCLIDISDVPEPVEIGEQAVIIGEQHGERITCDDLARELGTINYEICTQLAQRVPRIAVGN